MNDLKVEFIICTNSALYYEECLWYIHQLIIPDGYETDIICVAKARSMAEAYNAAMASSDAKYKVYLHQDVFIYHREFIIDILEIFRSNTELGMLGLVGGVCLPQDAKVYNSWNRGCTFLCRNSGKTGICGSVDQNTTDEKGYSTVEAVDGMLIATQYDIKWREDLNLGWDFYDVSQSLEFRRAGYHLGIPFQKTPWCMHDCGYIHINDDKVRQQILKEYRDFFSEKYVPLQGVEQIKWEGGELSEIQEQIFEIISDYFSLGAFENILQIRDAIGTGTIVCDNLQYAINLADIYAAENRDIKDPGSFFYNLQSFEEMKTKYDIIKFIVRHIENETNPAKTGHLYDLIKAGAISKEAVWSIGEHCAVYKGKLLQKLQSFQVEKCL